MLQQPPEETAVNLSQSSLLSYSTEVHTGTSQANNAKTRIKPFRGMAWLGMYGNVFTFSLQDHKQVTDAKET